MKNKFNKFDIIHFVGIGGIGMSGIAELMHNLGYFVQGSDIKINPNDSFVCDRSLDSIRFKEETSINISSWETMINNLYNEIKKEK